MLKMWYNRGMKETNDCELMGDLFSEYLGIQEAEAPEWYAFTKNEDSYLVWWALVDQAIAIEYGNSLDNFDKDRFRYLYDTGYTISEAISILRDVWEQSSDFSIYKRSQKSSIRQGFWGIRGGPS